MTPSIQTLPAPSPPAWEPQSPSHVAKRRKVAAENHTWLDHVLPTHTQVQENEDGQESHDAVPPHPLGIRPSGNAYEACINIKACCGNFTQLPDEVLLLLLEYLHAADLSRLGGTCKALYAFTTSEELWKTIFIDSPPENFSWRGSWRATYLSLPCSTSNHISCKGLYSDALYLPFHRAHVPLEPFSRNIPSRNQIARLSDLTTDDFNANWASKPFILTSPVKQWPAFKDWSIANLTARYQDTTFRAEAVDWSFKAYFDYMHNTTDESPLYLFDCRFAEKMHLTIGDNLSSTSTEPSYIPPSCFTPDLFTALGTHRPDHRWLIIGPARSGSTFHADPNGTSAWNAVLRGSKYWIMFPPTTDPLPGLHISPDSSHITAPLSIAEYLVAFHAAARQHPGCVEAVCGEGEVLHVPSGWFHLVLNLEAGVAVTQNFVPRAHLVEVLAFLRDKRAQVSGFEGKGEAGGGNGVGLVDGQGRWEGREYELFVERLGVEYPDLLEEALGELGRRDEKKGKKTKWEILNDGADAGFSFGFGFGDADDLEEGEEGA